MYIKIIRLISLIMCLAWALPAHAARQPDPQLAPLPDLKAVNLTMADLPAEPTHFATTTEWDDATMYARQYHKPVARLASEGFVALSLAQFQRATPTGSGVVQIVSEVSALSNAADARAGFARSLKDAAHTPGVTYTPLALGAAGDGSMAFKTILRDKAYSLPLTEESLFFSRGPYMVIMDLIGGSNTFPDHLILTLARLVDARIMAQIAHPISLLGGWNARAADFGTGFHLVSRADTATSSTVTYRKAEGSSTVTGTATVRSYINAQAAQTAARAMMRQMKTQGYEQIYITQLQGQMGGLMSRTLTDHGARKSATGEEVFAEDGFLVIDTYTVTDASDPTFSALGVGTTIDQRIIVYRVK